MAIELLKKKYLKDINNNYLLLFLQYNKRKIILVTHKSHQRDRVNKQRSFHEILAHHQHNGAKAGTAQCLTISAASRWRVSWRRFELASYDRDRQPNFRRSCKYINMTICKSSCITKYYVFLKGRHF